MESKGMVADETSSQKVGESYDTKDLTKDKHERISSEEA